MANSTTYFKLLAALPRLRSPQNKGFTLIELLIAVAISGIIITGLMYVAVEMLRLDRNEMVQSQTQQDMRRAMDYVSREVQEAVFVYPTPQDTAAIVAKLTGTPAGGTPIVSFWRVEPLSAADITSLGNCASKATVAAQDACTVLKLRQSLYTLVTYFVVNNTGTNTPWEGPARIVRHQVNPYTSLSSLTLTSGFVDPLAGGFENWATNAGATVAGTSVVLTDAIDSISSDTTVPTCDGAYQRIPSTVTENRFFVCVRDPALSQADIDALDVELLEGEVARDNQDVLIYLRGNATDNRPGLFQTASEGSRLPTLESRVLVRGILDKRPQ
jgi:prepilin-type N-terminal cleavage/methylation domain-containing protein